MRTQVQILTVEVVDWPLIVVGVVVDDDPDYVGDLLLPASSLHTDLKP